MQFKITKDPYDEGNYIFTKTKLTIDPDTVTCLVGCNGSGKSTLMNDIKVQLRENKATELKPDYYHNVFKGIFLNDKEKDYNTYYITFNRDADTSGREEDYFFNAAFAAMSSLGEDIRRRFSNYLKVIEQTVTKLKNKNLFIFLDDCDAGASLDLIAEIEIGISQLEELCRENNITYYIILTANSYELCRHYDCISVTDFAHKHFRSYESYKKFVIKSRIQKETLRNSWK